MKNYKTTLLLIFALNVPHTFPADPRTLDEQWRELLGHDLKELNIFEAGEGEVTEEPVVQKELSTRQKRLYAKLMANGYRQELSLLYPPLPGNEKKQNELKQQIRELFQQCAILTNQKTWYDVVKILKTKPLEETVAYLTTKESTWGLTMLGNFVMGGPLKPLQDLVALHDQCGLDITTIRTSAGLNLLDLAQQQGKLHLNTRKNVIQYLKPRFKVQGT